MRLIRIKKNLLCIFMILAISLSGFDIGYADDNVQVSLTSPSTQQVYKPGDIVEISGTAQNLAEVSIVIRNAQGILVFAGQPKVVNGVFATSFTLDSDVSEGKYTIYLGSLGLPEMKSYKFEVNNTGGTVVELEKPSTGMEFKAGDVVEIAGTAQKADYIAIFVRNSKNGRVSVAQPSVVDGIFSTKFTLASDAVEGEYTISITGSGLPAAKTSQFKVTSTSGGGSDPEEDTYLSINGSGVAKEVSFTRAELEAMTQERVLFSATSDWPQDKSVAVEGVPLQTILEQAGFLGAKMITFTGSDGYTIQFTYDELLNTTRYNFPGKVVVKPIIALKHVEGSSDFDDMDETNTPVICYGQRAQTEQTLLGFVKRLKTITVTSSSPGQWSKPTAKILAPSTQQKVATQGGEVESGSKIYLETGNDLKINIYYTTDGSDPDLNSKIFNPHGCGSLQGQVDSVLVDKDTTIKAKIVGRGKRDSDVLTLKFTVAGETQTSSAGGGSVIQQAVDAKNIKIEELSLENGRKGEKLTLQAGVLEDIEKGAQGSRLAITSTGNVEEVLTEVPAAMLQKAKDKEMSLGINSQIGNYTLPLDALNLSEIAAELGVKSEELILNIVISKATEDVEKKLTAKVQSGQQMLAEPLEFRVEIAASNGKKIEYKSFGSTYVERELLLSDTVNANQATGVVWQEAKGEFLPVPTRFETRDGKSIAVILNRTNSLYTVLQSSKTYSDIQNNWAKEDIELLAAKMLINGKSETTYEPDSNITRAEFANLLVRALGLEEGVLKEGQFNDVAITDWYAGGVATATFEKIITGYNGDLFKPNDNITREEMAVMIARAARVAGKEGTLGDSEQEQQLAQLTDRQNISSWASKEVALAVKAGIIKGMPGGDFLPQTYADRAQSAAILKRFLTHINFITSQ